MGLTIEDMKRKVSHDNIQKILLSGSFTQQKDSIWLLNFWSKEDGSGILLMPPTCHVMLHLNDCCKWKEYVRMNKKFYQ